MAQEVARRKNEEFFASMPPLEAMRALVSDTATNPGTGKEERKISFMDARKAHLNAFVTRDIYINLPEEDATPGYCGRLVRCLYGTRDAPARWEATYTETLQKLGFHRGRSNACCFYHPGRCLRLVVHGDDFVTTGVDSELSWFEAELQKVFEMKVRGRIGSGPKDSKQMTVLNRVVTYTPMGIIWEADQRHVEILAHNLGLTDGKGRTTPGQKKLVGKDKDEEK